MASEASFFGIPVVGSGTPSATADTSLTAPAHAVTLLGGQGPRQVVDGLTQIGGFTVSSTTASFNSGDIGRPISTANLPSNTVISYVLSAASVTVSQPASAGGANQTLTMSGGIGTKVEEVVWIPNTSGSSASVGVLTLFLYDGTTYHYIDEATVSAEIPTPTVPISATEFTRSPYTNLWIPPEWTLCFSSTVANQLATVTAFGGNA